jgi:WD40 repeat protein
VLQQGNRPLQAEGYEVASAQYGLDTNEGDVAATLRTLGKVGSRPFWSATPTVYSVAFSPGGKTLASGSQDGTVRLWNVAAHRETGGPLTGHTGQVGSVAFSPDGKTLASGSQDGTVRLWNVATGKQIGSSLGGGGVVNMRQSVSLDLGPVSSVAFSRDGKTLAAASEYGTMQLWDVPTRRPIGRVAQAAPGNGSPRFNLNSVAFSPDGKTLASGNGDGTVRL